AQENIFVITSVPDVNVTLNCAAKMKPGLQYYAVRCWFKPKMTFSEWSLGLVSKTLPDGQMMWYVDADTRVSLEEETLNLRLPTVTCSDQAVYQCYLAAPVGEQNRKGRVRLSVTGKPYTVSCFCFYEWSLFCRPQRSLKKTLWTQNKTPGKGLYPDPNCLPEKQDLLWIRMLGPPPKKLEPTAA
uniref:Ig-like domain-containing protein n=1 Tax=Periophthalmus magnuspinnatus TaxID=409849 RepID=A0A3B4ACG7_9GOBI